jgi:hypothetical protein
MVPVIAAHASLKNYLEYCNEPEIGDWLKYSFRKVVCKVNRKEFNTAMGFDKISIVTESSISDKSLAIVLTPRNEWPKPVKFYKLWRPSIASEIPLQEPC